MLDNDLLPQKIYSEHLTSINNVRFSKREVDVISCILNGRSAKGIAHLLSISSKTAEAHTYNVMKKFDCSSREGLIRLIENSDKFFVFKRYYLSLLLSLSFEKRLKEISQKQGEGLSSCLIFHWEKDTETSQFITQLQAHLKLAGINVSIEYRENTPDFSKSIQKSQKQLHIIYIMPNGGLENAGDKSIIPNPSEGRSHIHFIYLKGDAKKMMGYAPIDFSHQNYYLGVFELLKRILPSLQLEQIIAEFRVKCESTIGSEPQKSSPSIIEAEQPKTETSNQAGFTFRNKKRAVLTSFFIFGIIGLGLLFVWIDKGTKPPEASPLAEANLSITRSDLIIPTEAAFLDRSDLIAQLQNKFKGRKDIHIVALIGPGGAGKTTLARQYAKQQKANIIWEINAETKETLRGSFERLADAIAKTESDKRILRSLKDIKEPSEKEDKIILFVKEHLRAKSNWFLVFDNVEKSEDIQKYYPQDIETWGLGNVILTTRNSNITNNQQISDVVQIGELNDKQKLDLFIKIVNTENDPRYTAYQNEETIKFLKEIPSYPLDISIAAYYLKTTHIPYEKYLKNLDYNNKDFASLQVNILKESSDYTKTRYSITTMSLQNLITENKAFGDLLLFIALLDSQNIPRELLEKFKNEGIVDNFIFNAKKYSLITDEPSSLGQSFTISIHRGTQTIILDYLIKHLECEKKRSLIKSIANQLIEYTAYIIEKEDLLRMRDLESHYIAFLRHNDLLEENLKGLLTSEFGYIKYYLGSYIESKQMLDKAVTIFPKYYSKKHIKYAEFITYMGIVNREIGNYDIARGLLEQSCEIYKRNFPKNYDELARALSYLGITYRNLGNYKKAQDKLEQSLLVYKKHCPKNYSGTARTLGYLGYVYRYLGEYKKSKNLIEQSQEIYIKHLPDNQMSLADIYIYLGTIHLELCDFEKAKQAFEKSLIIFRELSSNIDVAWALGFLGKTYKELGEYDKAKRTLMECLSIYEKFLPENHVDIAWALTYLGDLYNTLGDYEKAKGIFETGYALYKKTLGENNVITSWTLTYLGDGYQELGNYSQARVLLERSLHILKTHFGDSHPRVGWTMLQLGKVYLHLGNFEKAKDSLENCLTIYKKYYGKDNLEIARVLLAFGQVYLSENNIQLAQRGLQNSLIIFQKYNSPEIYMVLENLAELYFKKSLQLKETQESKNFKTQAVNYLKQALTAVNKYFPKDSPHVLRIQNKLKSLEGDNI